MERWRAVVVPLVIARVLTGAYIGCVFSTDVKLVPEPEIPAAITEVLGGLMIGAVGVSNGQITGLVLVCGMVTVLGNARVGRLAGCYASPIIVCDLQA